MLHTMCDGKYLLSVDQLTVRIKKGANKSADLSLQAVKMAIMSAFV